MNWRLIRNLGQIKYFNISYIVLLFIPIFANIVQIINKNQDLNYSIPITIKSIYIASIFYAIAIAIYQYRCPELIKEYKNVQDYIERNLEQFKNKLPDLKLNIVLAHIDKEIQKNSYEKIKSLYGEIKNTTDIVSKREKQVELDKTLNDLYPSCVQSHLTKKYNDENNKNPLSIKIAGLLYITGTLILIFLLVIRTLLVLNT